MKLTPEQITKTADTPDELTAEETKRLIMLLEALERETTNSMGYRYISGGFAVADMFNYDDETIDVELTFGIQSDVQNTTHKETLEINRMTMQIID